MMKVDGLTNDEVKSHLQYRLHTRRPIQRQQGGASTQPPQLVVLGGKWVSPEYATSTAAAAGGPTIYDAHPAPTHYCIAPMPQDFYTPLTHNHHSLRRDTAPAIYKSRHGQSKFDVRGDSVAADGNLIFEEAGRAAKRQERKRSERYTVAAVMSTLGITSMDVVAVYYRFSWQMEGGAFAEMLGTFSLSIGATALWHASHMHELHHRPREGPFELNDVFAIINVVPAIALLSFGF